MAPHQEFLELCAVSIAGELTTQERQKLDEHLRVCASCRKALEQYQLSVKAVIPSVAESVPLEPIADLSLPVQKAEAAFFSRFDREGGFQPDTKPDTKNVAQTGTPASHDVDGPSGVEWAQLGMPVVAMIVLAVGLGVLSYYIGIKRGGQTAARPQQRNATLAALEERLSDAGHDREQLRSGIAERERENTELKKQIHQLSAQMQRNTDVSANAQKTLDDQAASKTAAELGAFERRLEAKEQERLQQQANASALQAKLDELSQRLQESEIAIARQKRELQEQEATINRQQDFLAHDRDVRDLMGARDLYVAELYDINDDGKTNKPYGRVFYTKGKSIILYAYDLDQQPGLRNASTFQAWGQRGPDKNRALSLGVFYEDSAANRRWILKFTDPKTISEIDAVFVTVEPDGHSHTPRGKQVLFAYLHIPANHP